ncbi:hypothetical protein [Moorena producens]|nr:hypothetical protein [Moorena producens]
MEWASWWNWHLGRTGILPVSVVSNGHHGRTGIMVELASCQFQ